MTKVLFSTELPEHLTVVQKFNEIFNSIVRQVHPQAGKQAVLKQIGKLDLFTLDELGYIPLHKQGGELLFQVISMVL
ncbi:ATP-binding protein [Bacillus sp. CLL-7-23]|uniref:ATP-binding protein n=1 Tax=Bacillus changyiensis TaxID=3004103 RepID=A0ABT4X7S7_9BACI|nr:ATP-binding protein [Bacillus changyiensis]MDA7028329.1 ATP-binding protein [Bacillus changyiensis]